MFTSDIISDASAEAASPGDEDPLKDLPIYAARLHDDDWSRSVKEKPEPPYDHMGFNNILGKGYIHG